MCFLANSTTDYVVFEYIYIFGRIKELINGLVSCM